jgi:hypothetical protein
MRTLKALPSKSPPICCCYLETASVGDHLVGISPISVKGGICLVLDLERAFTRRLDKRAKLLLSVSEEQGIDQYRNGGGEEYGAKRRDSGADRRTVFLALCHMNDKAARLSENSGDKDFTGYVPRGQGELSLQKIVEEQERHEQHHACVRMSRPKPCAPKRRKRILSGEKPEKRVMGRLQLAFFPWLHSPA